MMNGEIEGIDWKFKPEQMHAILPFFCLIILGFFNSVFFSLVAKLGFETPIKKITLGCFFSCAAFLMSAVLHYKLFVNIAVL